ncbi:ASCH domain-containing protein [Methylosinus sp. Ce-a6]|uniref:ASCH domain-containing protein n=1 Tax=Methylosinus sp. Ce-a6 TaxID=2172005 RepID=UPI001359FE72
MFVRQHDYPPKGLIIREPWVSLILDGLKTWELRGTRTAIRGRIGLIRSGSGAVVGEAELFDVVGPLDRIQLAESVDRHCVRFDWTIVPLPYRSVYAWVIKKPKRYSVECPYIHPPGAVIWVKLAFPEN